jgi:hypothetical protein
MKLVSIMAVAGLGMVLAAPLAAQTVQDFLKPVEKPKGPVTAENYVDPQIAEPVGGYFWRQEIGRKFVSFKIVSSVIAAGECTCQLRYPDIDQFRADIEALWEGLGNKPWPDFSDEQVSEFYRVKDKIMRSYSSDLAQYGRLCRAAGL